MGRLLPAALRKSPASRRVALAATSVAAVILAAVALAPPANRAHPAHRPARGAPDGVRATRSVQPQEGARLGADLARARAAARVFLAGYLRFAYGQSPASSVGAAAPALRRQLTGDRVLVPPAERRRHPRVVSLVTAERERGAVAATALVDDGGITNYAVRITLRRTRSGWLVSTVAGG